MNTRRNYLLWGLLWTWSLSGLAASAQVTFQSLQATYQTSMTKIEAEHQAAMMKLEESHVRVLGRIADLYQQRGDLEKVISIKNEVDRFKAERTLPDAPDPEWPESVPKAQAEYATQVEKEMLTFEKDYVVLTDRYVKYLQALTKKLTSEDKIDEAVATREEAQEVHLRDRYVNARKHLEAYTAGVRAKQAALAKPKPKHKLLFEDSFERTEIGGAWKFKDVGLKIEDGRVAAHMNTRILETTQTLSGDLRIEVDLDREGDHTYSMWDHMLIFSAMPKRRFILRFNHEKIDQIRFEREEAKTIKGSAPDQGRLVITYKDGKVHGQFTNRKGGVLETDWYDIGQMESTKIQFWLAGHASTPRFIDNVKIYALSK